MVQVFKRIGTDLIQKELSPPIDMDDLEKTLGRKLGQGKKPDVTLTVSGLFTGELETWSSSVLFNIVSGNVSPDRSVQQLDQLHQTAIRLMNEAWREQ